MKFPLLRTVAALFLSVAFPIGTVAQVTFTQIAISGDDAVDEEGNATGEIFDWFNDIVLNATGDYAFRAGLTWSAGVDKDSDSGAWANLDGDLKLVALEGGDAPGTEDPLLPSIFAQYKDIIGSGGSLALGDSGVLGFRSRLFVGGGSAATDYTNFGVWVAEAGAGAFDVALVAREGDDAPDSAALSTGATFDLAGTFPLVCDGDGSVAFYSGLYVGRASSNATSKDRFGIWLWDSGTAELSQVGRSAAFDDPVIETAEGTAEKHFGAFTQPVINTAGSVGFMARLRVEPKYDSLGNPIEDRVTSKNASGVWLGPQGALGLLARAGESSGGGTFLRIFNASANAGGTCAFRAQLTGGATGSPRTADTGIWSTDGATLTQIAIEGGAAAGTVGGTFGQFRFDPLIGNSGDISFLARLTVSGTIDRDSDEGIWLNDPIGGLSLVARENDVASISPGTPITPPSGSADVRFGRLHQPSLNQNGQVAFLAVLKSAPVGLTSAENRAIFAQRSTDNALLLVIRLGDPLAGKTVKGLAFVTGSGGGDGRARGWVYNSSLGSGKLAFTARFTDGTSGAFIATVP
jgi:hypothetical protein